MMPLPTSVPYNDWRQVEAEPLETFVPTLPVSVVIPAYRTPAATLARTLAALEGQTYPRDLWEVLLVDDGSQPPLERPRSAALDVRVVRQERRGFGLARARNTGAGAAAGDILIFLDSDTLVEADWLAAHARWHHAVCDALTLGSRVHVAVDGLDAETIRGRPGALRELLADRPAGPREVESLLLRTRGLTTRADDVFNALTGGNFGVGQSFYRLVGGMDESFTRWGAEDTEFSYRAYARGGAAGAGPGGLGLAPGALGGGPSRQGAGEADPAGEGGPPDCLPRVPRRPARPHLCGAPVRGDHRRRTRPGRAGHRGRRGDPGRPRA